MKRILNFGKIDLNNTGRKINKVTIEIELRQNNGIDTLSICGNVWNQKQTDTVLGGQCLDELVPFFKNNKLFNEVYRLWKNYHLNDLKPGTPEQMECIKNHKDEIDESLGFYTKELELLKKYGLDVVDLNGEQYKYGTKWLYQPIPENDLEIIKTIINEGNLYN